MARSRRLLVPLGTLPSGKVELALETVDLNETVRQVCESCLSQMREKSIHLKTALPDDAALIAVDSRRLQQVLLNLLTNAIKFTPENGTIRITTARQSGGQWKLQIQDSGIGITVEILPRIFDFFEQGGVSVTRQFGGLGLGLAICKGIVELHRGSGTAERSGFAVEDDFREKNLVLRLFLPIWRRYNEIGPVCVVAQGADRSFLASKQLISRCKLCDDDRR
jgi:signal transduction histidine kinase